MKKCYKCKKTLEEINFSKCSKEKDGLQSKCKTCFKEYQSQRYANNKEQINASNKDWYEKNRAKVIERTVQYKKDRRQSDPLFKATVNLRRRLNRAIKATRWNKTSNFTTYIGCSLGDLRAHLENQFKPGMSWDNYGEWHIDHMIPLSSAKSEAELLELSNHKNLQPLWALENLVKGIR